MNETIETIFNNFKVDNVSIPVAFLFYEGNEDAYVVYQQASVQETFSADDELEDYVDYYYFHIYSKGNYLGIVKEVKKLLKQNNFRWNPFMSSSDMYEVDTGYYHKVLCFSIERFEEEE